MKKYISEATKLQIYNADPGAVRLLVAPTGSGKTYFVLKWLWPRCRLVKRNILLVVNRQSLRGQLIQNILRDERIELMDEELVDSTSIGFDCLTIISYQSLQKIICGRSPLSKIWIEHISSHDFYYVIFDEAHYFLNDSLFNAETYWLRDIRRFFSKSVRVYISATMGPVKGVILKKLEHAEPASLYDEVNGNYDAYIEAEDTLSSRMGLTVRRDMCCIFGAKADYSYFTPCVFSSDLKELITKNYVSGERWLVFVDSVKEAVAVKTALEQSKIKAAVVASETRTECETEVLDEIRKTEKFSADVLLATPVIDNGVSIKDEMVCNIVLSGTEEISAVQQAGRIRVLDNQNIKLWIRERRKEFFCNRILKRTSEKEFLSAFDLSSSKEKVKMLLDCEMRDISNFLLPVGDTNRVNSLAVEALEYYIAEDKKCYESLKKGRDAYFSRILGFFGLEYRKNFDLPRSESEGAEAELKNYLRANLVITKDRTEVVFSDMKKLYEKATGRLLCPGHKKRGIGPNIAKRIWDEMGFDWIKDKKSGEYKLTERGVEKDVVSGDN